MAEGNAETVAGRLGAGDRLLEGMRVGAVDQAAAEATRCRVVETAERLFRQFGYLKTTVGDIAAELGMSPANIYRFFASKAAITEAVLQKVTGEVIEEARAVAAEPEPLRRGEAAPRHPRLQHARSASAASPTAGCTRWCMPRSTRTGT